MRLAIDKEQETIAAATKGNTAAMKLLYEQHIGYLTAVCSRYIRSNEDVRDILQDSFVKIFSSIGSFSYRGSGSLRAWMTRIVVNEALKSLRKTEKTSFAEVRSGNVPEVEDEEPETENIPPAVLQQMIRSLQGKYRTVFNLYVFQELSHKEIAKLLDITEGTSASCLHRAKKQLIDMINEYRSGRAN